MLFYVLFFLIINWLYSVENIQVLNKDLVLKNEVFVSNFKSKILLKSGVELKLIRSFEKNKKEYCIAVDKSSLKTFFLECLELKSNSQILNSTSNSRSTKFDNLLIKYKSETIKNMNLEASKTNEIRIFLTIDMCPSFKENYNKEFLFNWLNGIKKDIQKIPLGISITKKWAENHQEAFKELQNFEHLDITWINHSADHELNCKENYCAFLTAENTNFKDQVLKLEEFLLSKELMPSVFFRFPGLVCNKKLLEELNKMSLLGLDSNTWINKGQKIKDGSIVLLHGNQNEDVGIKKFKLEYAAISKEKDVVFSNLTL